MTERMYIGTVAQNYFAKMNISFFSVSPCLHFLDFIPFWFGFAAGSHLRRKLQTQKKKILTKSTLIFIFVFSSSQLKPKCFIVQVLLMFSFDNEKKERY